MKKYNKPVLRVAKKNNFVFDVLGAHVKENSRACRQCSSCHGCRG